MDNLAVQKNKGGKVIRLLQKKATSRGRKNRRGISCFLGTPRFRTRNLGELKKEGKKSSMKGLSGGLKKSGWQAEKVPSTDAPILRVETAKKSLGDHPNKERPAKEGKKPRGKKIERSKKTDGNRGQRKKQ